MKAALGLWLVLLAGCSSEAVPSGVGEPLRVRYSTQAGQFRAGALPGSPPLTDEQVLTHVEPDPPSVSLNVGGSIVRSSDSGFSLNGSTSNEAVAVGVRFLDLGSGYWILPVTGQDATRPGTFNWAGSVDFGADLPAGYHPLGVVAIDGAGHAGTQTQQKLCVASDIPDNLSSCSPGATPPDTVLSLVWDTPVDLDLRVITPQGKVVDPKHPSTALAVDGHVDPTVKGTGSFDTDGVRACQNVGRRRENLVWNDAPGPGRYFVYASLYDACGQPAVRFNVSLNRPGPAEADGTHHLLRSFERAGELLASDADAGVGRGLFVTEFIVQ